MSRWMHVGHVLVHCGVLLCALQFSPGVGADIEPEALLVYYGYPSLINGATTNVEAAGHLSAYDHVIIGSGMHDPGHPDHSNVLAIFADPSMAGTKTYGYIDVGVTSAGSTLSEIEAIVDAWVTTGVDGVLLDFFGYDFGTSRTRQNAIVDYVHGAGLVAVVDAFVPAQALGSDVDPTHNPGGVAPSLSTGDIYMFADHQISANAFVSEVDWLFRADALETLRVPLGVEVFSVTTTNVDDVNAYDEDKFFYSWYSALLHGHLATGWSEYEFSSEGTSNGMAPFRARPPVDAGISFAGGVVNSSPLFTRTTDTGVAFVRTDDHSYGFLTTAPLLEVFVEGSYDPMEKAIVDTPRPTIRISGSSGSDLGAVMLERDDGQAGIGGAGKPILECSPKQTFDCLAETSPGVFEGTIETLVGVNRIVVSSIAGTAQAEMLNYTTGFEDLNGNGLLDIDEDANENGVLDPGEDLNGNLMLDFDEDVNGNGTLTTTEDLNDNGVLDEGEDFNENGVIDSLDGDVTSFYPAGANDYGKVGHIAYSKRAIGLVFESTASRKQINQFLNQHGLKPIRLDVDITKLTKDKLVGVRVPAGQDAVALVKSLNGLPGAGSDFYPDDADMPVDSPLKVAILLFTGEVPLPVVGEEMPARLRLGGATPTGTGNVGEGYNEATGGFDHDGDTCQGGTVHCDELDIAWQHFFMQTFPAHRLLGELAPSGSRPELGIVDTGLGDGTGATLVDFQVGAGTRVIQPTLCSGVKSCKRVKLSRIPDEWTHPQYPSGDHGTSVTHLAAGAGIRVLGLGKDARVRPLKAAGPMKYEDFARAMKHAAVDSSLDVVLVEFQITDFDLNNDGLVTDVVVDGFNELRYAFQAMRTTEDELGSAMRSLRRSKKIIIVPAGNASSHTDFSFLAGAQATPLGNLKALFDAPIRGARTEGQKNAQVIGVANTSVNGFPQGPEVRAPSSNYGTRISVGAPGRFTVSLEPDQDFAFFGGTSAAAPQVAGLAVMLQYFNENYFASADRYKRFQIVQLIEATADDLGTTNTTATAAQLNDNPGNGHDDSFGYGRINAWKALLSAVNGGLANQFGRTDADDNGHDDEFESLDLVDEEDTEWYGFEILTTVPNVTVWIDDEELEDPDTLGPDGITNSREGDDDDLMPRAPKIRPYKGIRSDRSGARGVHVAGDGSGTDPTGSIIEEDPLVGVVPVGKTANGNSQYVIHFSIKRSDLYRTNAQGAEVPRTLTLRIPNSHGPHAPVFNLRLETAKMRTGEVTGVTFDDYVFQITPSDYGDAPIPPGLLSENGPRHVNSNLEWLGKHGRENRYAVSAEHNADSGDSVGGDVSVDPDGLDNRDGGRDRDGRDDGVTFFPLTYIPGANTGRVDFGITVSDVTSSRYQAADPDRSLWMNIWIDWNTDGDWDDAGEHVVKSVRIAPGAVWSVVPVAGATTTEVIGQSAVTHSAEFKSTITVPGVIGTGALWARARLDYGENVGANDPRPFFRSLPSLRDPSLAQNVPQEAGMGIGYTAGAARFGEVEDYLITTDFGDAAGYPTLKADDGARHLTTRYEWFGPAVTREFDANGVAEVDGEPNLNTDDDDAADDGVEFLTPLTRGAMATVKFTVTTSASTMGVTTGHGLSIPEVAWHPTGKWDSLPRYQYTDAQRRLYIAGWADWDNDGDWDDAGEKIIDTDIDPATFLPNQKYTLGEPFDDVNGNGVYDDAEPFEDTNSNGVRDAGEPYEDLDGDGNYDTNFTDAYGTDTGTKEVSFRVPGNSQSDVRFRFRLSYGENETTIVNHGLIEANEVDADGDIERVYAETRGGALFGEVEDYPKTVRGAITTTCGDGILEGDEECDDGNTASGDCCSGTCTYEAQGSFCSDGNFCTGGETCDGLGSCTGGDAIICDDGNVCTSDSCDPLGGCIFTPNANSCDDANPCTVGDSCSGGTCQAGSPRDCNDGSSCTADGCDPGSGCTHVPIPDCGGGAGRIVPALTPVGVTILLILLVGAAYWASRRMT